MSLTLEATLRRAPPFTMVAMVLAAGAAVAVGCSEDPPNATTDATDAGTKGTTEDAAPEAAATPMDASPGRDCARDLMGDGLPGHLDCTGLYTNLASKTVPDGVLPYTPGAQLWSDGATKSRFVYLPPGTTIDATDPDDWKMPVGTKLWKEFALDGKRIETRLYQKTAAATWKHTTYRWNADESDAERLDTGDVVPRAGTRAYEVPRSDQCTQCHKGRTEPTLGFDAVGLGLPGAAGATLAKLVETGRIAPAPAATSFSVPGDGTAAAAKAAAWLHANCGSCHQSSPAAEAFYTQVFFRIRAAQLGDGGVASAQDLDAVKTTCGITSSKVNPDGGTPLVRLAPGSPDTSAVYVLSASRSAEGKTPNANEQMPPMLSHLVDPEGTGAVRDWIAANTKCPKN